MFLNQHIQIPAPLQSYVKNIWVLDSTGVNNIANSFSIYADGCPGIIFHQSDGEMFLNQGQKKLSPIFLYGQTVEPVTLDSSGRLRMIVMNFYPHIMQSVFRFSAREVTDDCIDLNLLPAVPRINLSEKLWNTVSTGHQVNILFEYLQKLIEKNDTGLDNGMAHATSAIIKTNGCIELKSLQASLNLTERTFERKFEQHVGVSPKLFSKITQFQSALTQMKNKKFSKLSDIAYENGYADQSHFIRNFRKFSGLSPLEYMKQIDKTFDNFPALIN